MLGLVESLAPAREGSGKGLMVDVGGKPRVLEQQVEIALEGPQNGAEPPRLMGEVVDIQDFGS